MSCRKGWGAALLLPLLDVLGEPSALPEPHRRGVPTEFSFRYLDSAGKLWLLVLSTHWMPCAGAWRRGRNSSFSQLKEGEWLRQVKSGKLLTGWLRALCMEGLHKGHSPIPLFTHLALLSLLFRHLLGHPPHDPAQNRASNQGKVNGPQKSSQTQHKEVENQTQYQPCPLESTFGVLGGGEEWPGGCTALRDRPSPRGAREQSWQNERGSGLSVHPQDPTSSPELNSC